MRLTEKYCMLPTGTINAAINKTVVPVDAANSATHALTDLILIHKSNLDLDSTVVAQLATLLQHAVQNYRRIFTKALEGKKSKKEAMHDS